jgi:hypothetical protein
MTTASTMNLVESELEKDKAFQEIPIMYVVRFNPFIHFHLDIVLSISVSYRDLRDMNSEDLARRADLAQIIKDACMRVGFFYGT